MTTTDKPKLGPDPPPATPEPVTVTVGDGPGEQSWAEVQSQRASNIAAGKQPQAWTVAGSDAAPADFPVVLYNHKTRQTKVAKDDEEKKKLEKDGFEEDPLPPEDPDALTQDEIKELEALLAKAAKALTKLGKLSAEEKDDKAKVEKSATVTVKK